MDWNNKTAWKDSQGHSWTNRLKNLLNHLSDYFSWYGNADLVVADLADNALTYNSNTEIATRINAVQYPIDVPTSPVSQRSRHYQNLVPTMVTRSRSFFKSRIVKKKSDWTPPVVSNKVKMSPQTKIYSIHIK